MSARKLSFIKRGLIIFVVAVLIVLVTGVSASYIITRPLAKSLVINTSTPPATVVAAVEIVDDEPEATAEPPAPTVEAAPQPKEVQPSLAKSSVCGMTGTLDLLFNGTGEADGMITADAIRLLRFDFDQASITVVAFPRDLWVKTGSLADLNISEAKLGESYYFKQAAVKGDERAKTLAGTNVVAQSLYDNFQVRPHHYLTLNLVPFGKMIDTIGGVEIEVPYDLPLNTGEVLPAGKRVLDGRLSMEYIRALALGGDAARIQRQNLYVQGLRDKVLNARIIPRVPALLAQFNEVLVTDLSAQQLISLACMAEAVPSEQIVQYRIDEEMYTFRADEALIPDVHVILSSLAKWLK